MIDRALSDPARLFASPFDVLADARLSGAQKLAVLERWQNETLTLPACDAECALGGARNRLSEVLRAKQALLDGSAEPPMGATLRK